MKSFFTSFHDDRFGAGGTFDTDATQDSVPFSPGDWAGMFFGHQSRASLDHALITMAGGVTTIEGNFAQFNPIEIHQATVRIANSTIRDNTDGISDPDIFNLDGNRAGRGPNASAAVFVRGAQPILAANTLRENEGYAFNINVNSLNSFFNADPGRSTGPGRSIRLLRRQPGTFGCRKPDDQQPDQRHGRSRRRADDRIRLGRSRYRARRV